ncbi:MAG TPA: recombinase family protein [Planctomycetota bacterium]|nr:recombinase family protein [Planctomycetota bacterium]
MGDAEGREGRAECGAAGSTHGQSVRCAIYTRESGRRGPEGQFDSVEAQRAAAESFIARRAHEGWAAVGHRYDDRGISGARMDRPALLRLLADASDGRLDCVVVHKLDRLARSLPRFARLAEALRRLGVGVVSVTQPFDTGTSVGRLSLHALLAFAEFEREIIAERQRDGWRRAQRNGRHVVAAPMLGYNFRPGSRDLVVDEREAAVVREIFALYLEHRSAIRVAEELNRRGRRTKAWLSREGDQVGGIEFTDTGVSRMLANVAYAGKTRCGAEILPARHEAIIPEETFNDARAIRSANRCAPRTEHPPRLAPALLGRLRCRACQAPMRPIPRCLGKREVRFYACTAAKRHGWLSCPTKAVSVPAAERAVAELLRHAGSGPEALRDLLRPPPGTSPSAALELERAVHGVVSVLRRSWDLLDRRERARAVRSLVAEADYDARDGTLGVNLSARGLEWLAGRPACRGGEDPAGRLEPPFAGARLEAKVDPVAMGCPSSAKAWTPPQYMTPAERLAFAHAIEALIRDGRAANYVEAARLLNYSEGRLVTLSKLRFLAPAVQQELLWVGEDALRHVREIDLCRIADELDWDRQWELWAAVRARGPHPGPSHEAGQGHRAVRDRHADARLRGELERLPGMAAGELGRRYSELFGGRCPCRRRCFLQRSIAWRLQALALGGLSEAAEARLKELGGHVLARVRSARLARP